MFNGTMVKQFCASVISIKNHNNPNKVPTSLNDPVYRFVMVAATDSATFNPSTAADTIPPA